MGLNKCSQMMIEMFRVGLKYNIPPDNLDYSRESDSYSFDLCNVDISEEDVDNLVAEMEYMTAGGNM